MTLLFERVWDGREGLQNSLRKLWGDEYIQHFVGGDCCMSVHTQVQTHQIVHLKMYSLFIAVYLSKKKRLNIEIEFSFMARGIWFNFLLLLIVKAKNEI